MSYKARVLITDDSGYMRQVIRKFLEPNGYEVVGEASNGLESISMAKELKPNLITMDISMKELGGIETTSKIKAEQPDIKIIMISAIGETQFIKNAINAGASDYIIKPFTEKRLISSIQTVLGS